MNKLSIALVFVFLAILSSLLPSHAYSRIKTPNLVGAWSFEGNANDWSGNGNNGVLHGAILASGKFGQGYSFNALGQYIDAGNNNVLNLISAGTVSAWIYDTNALVIQGIVIKGVSTWDALNSYNLYIKDASTLTFSVGDGVGASNQATYSIALNTWYFVVGTWDGSRVKLYVNGVLRSDVAQTITLAGNASILQIGQMDLWSYYLAGTIDEVRIYNRALTAGEIRALMLGFEPGE